MSTADSFQWASMKCKGSIMKTKDQEGWLRGPLLKCAGSQGQGSHALKDWSMKIKLRGVHRQHSGLPPLKFGTKRTVSETSPKYSDTRNDKPNSEGQLKGRKAEKDFPSCRKLEIELESKENSMGPSKLAH